MRFVRWHAGGFAFSPPGHRYAAARRARIACIPFVCTAHPHALRPPAARPRQGSSFSGKMTLRERTADTFSLLCRTVATGTDIDSCNGHNLPLLVLFRIILSQRNLAFSHTESDTNALATFINTSFVSAKVAQAARHLAEAFCVNEEDMDIAMREQVRLWRALTLQ